MEDDDLNIKERIVRILKEKECPPQYPDQLMDMLEISKDDQQLFMSILEEMVDEGMLMLTRKKKYALPEDLGFLTGRLQSNAKGFGFLIPDDKDEKDVFISPPNMHGAMHNDRIMVRLLTASETDSWPSREGEIIRILERANKQVVGTFEHDKYFGFVVPDDTKIAQDIFISKDEMNGAKSGYKVVAEITKWPEDRRNPEGRIVEILGHKDEPGTDILSIIRQYDLPEDFPGEVMSEARNIPQKISEKDIKGRRDLRDLKLFTIDGADARDFDDAVSIEIVENGNYLLGVHIADVTHYVKTGTALDKEAYKRGNSIYLVDRVIPMLPKELSNGICSLNPNEDRLAMSVFIEIDKKGKVIKHSIEETVICSKARLVYDDITSILEDGDKALEDKYREFLDDFKLMNELREILYNNRVKRGSIDFDLDETMIKLDENGKPIEVCPEDRGIANQIIEEFMIICNETIAQHMFWSNMPFVYRVHEEPDLQKMLDFNEFIHNFGYHLKGIGGGEIHPKVLQTVLNQAKGTREERIISAVMLRSLQKAKYNEKNLGHFGLAAKYYCHFTSPIRRYPDLMIHRIIKGLLHGNMDEKRISKLDKFLPELSDHCSKTERLADDVERETEDLKKAEFMQDKIDNEYDGIVSGVTQYGIYVQLENTVEGLVRLSSMEDDYYSYDEKHYCVIGTRTRKIYRLGDLVRIKVIKVDLPSRNIDFVLVD